MQFYCCRNVADFLWCIVQVLYAVMSDEDTIPSLAAASSNPGALHNEGVRTINHECQGVAGQTANVHSSRLALACCLGSNAGLRCVISEPSVAAI